MYKGERITDHKGSFSVPEDEVERLSALVREIMENVAKLRVPLVVDVQTGANWAEAH